MDESLSSHYGDVITGTMASQITSLTIVYSTVYSGADQRKHQSSPSLAFVRGIHQGPVNSPHKWPVTRNLFPFDDVIMHEEWFQPHATHAQCRWIIGKNVDVYFLKCSTRRSRIKSANSSRWYGGYVALFQAVYNVLLFVQPRYYFHSSMEKSTVLRWLS